MREIFYAVQPFFSKKPMFEGRNEVPFIFMDNVYIQRPPTLYFGGTEK
jgi:hypothetical protein